MQSILWASGGFKLQDVEWTLVAFLVPLSLKGKMSAAYLGEQIKPATSFLLGDGVWRHKETFKMQEKCVTSLEDSVLICRDVSTYQPHKQDVPQGKHGC